MLKKTQIHGLWVGSNKLKELEQLTLASFVNYDCEFNLWTYEPLKSIVPTGVVIHDGNELIPESKMFRYPSDMIISFGGNNLVGFSEVFRYKVMYEMGGWWSDLDVVCLKPPQETTDEYWFRFHGILSVVGNIMKMPAKSELMKRCLERAELEVNEHQRDWHHAIRILCYNIELLGLSKFIHYDKCNLDRLDKVNFMVNEPGELTEIPANWQFIHWMNSVINKNYAPNSIFEKLLKKHNINIVSRKIYL